MHKDRTAHIRLLRFRGNKDKLSLSSKSSQNAGGLYSCQSQLLVEFAILPTCSATGPPNSSLRLTYFFTVPAMKASKSSTDSGRASWTGFGDGAFATGGAGRGPVGAGVGAPLIAGISMEEDAMSSSLEVAASSLLRIAVRSILWMVGMELSSMMIAELAEYM